MANPNAISINALSSSSSFISENKNKHFYSCHANKQKHILHKIDFLLEILYNNNICHSLTLLP